MEELRTVRLSAGVSLPLGIAARMALQGLPAQALSEPKLNFDPSLLIVFSGTLCLLDELDIEEVLEEGAGFLGAGEEVLPWAELEDFCCLC